MSEMVERVADVLGDLPYRVISRGKGRSQEWFVDDGDNLPAGEFVAGPFTCQHDADRELARLQARAAIETMREPAKDMLFSGAQWASVGDPFGVKRWQEMIDAALSS